MNLKDIIEILRPINCIMGTLTVIIGILNTRTGIPLVTLIVNLILGILTYFFIAGSSMVINDIYDFESGIDVINRPNRPIPSGRITVPQAKLIFIFTLGIGVAISIIHSIIFTLGFINVLLAVFFGFIAWLYSAWAKKQGFIGNITVSISFSIGLLYGAVLNSSFIPIYMYLFFLTSFFLLLSREIVKGCEDIEGDKEEGVKTLAIKFGFKKAINFSIVFEICAIIFFILPIFTEIINSILFLFSMMFGVITVAFALISSLHKNLTRKDFKKISLMLKIGAFLGLIAFIFASI